MDEHLERRTAVRLGAVSAVAGAILFLIALLWHGDLPDQTTAIALRHIAGRPEWHFLHLTSIIAVVLWIGAFAGAAHSLPAGAGRLLARVAALAVTLGAAVFVVHYSIDGYRLKDVADAWNATSGEHQARHLIVAQALFGVLGGTFRTYIAILYGVPFVLLGLGITRSEAYPGWFGWVAVIAGAGAVVAGTTLFLDVPVVPFPLLFGGFVIPLNLWLAALGVLTWRRAAQEAGASQEARAR